MGKFTLFFKYSVRLKMFLTFAFKYQYIPYFDFIKGIKKTYACKNFKLGFVSSPLFISSTIG